MRHQVPQYLEVEDRIFGPLTLKQFVFVAGGVGGAYLAWAATPAPWSYLLALAVGGACALLGFGTMNGRPFMVVLESAASFLVTRKFYLWRRAPKPAEVSAAETVSLLKPAPPRLSDSRLKDLAWGLDIHEELSAGNIPRAAELARPTAEPPRGSLRDPLAE